MNSSARLDSIVFQLTPTRTRCDLVISANGKTEKIASGLLNPFLAHLKAAQDQIGKGGYSIVLETRHGSDATWFTKGTVERFVRFVSTPEILERVYTIESEILQIEKAICFQNSHDTGSHVAEDFPVKSEESLEGSRPALGGNEEKAIVLYQPSSHQSEENGSTVPQQNSKVQLVQVLETRKIVLQKEQGMAFARAAAASFDIDNIAALLAFAECFGASRMMDACKKFMHLWKAKHESGQWVEVETADALSYRADLPSTNAAGIVFHSPNDHKEFKDSLAQGDNASEKNGTPDRQVQPIPQEYSPGQFPHPMFAPWQMHFQASGIPAFQPYPMQGMPCYQNYPGNNPYFQSPYPPPDDARLHSGQKTRQRRHSMDSRDLSFESEDQETDTSGRKMQDDVKTDDEDSVSWRRSNKGGKSSRKQSGKVVIRNINYIASAKQGSGDSDPQSCSDSGTDEGTRKPRKKGGYQMPDVTLKSSFKEERMSGQAGDDGHWQAFQNFLLTDANESSNSKRSDMYAMEGKVQGRNRKSAIGDASSALGRRSMGGNGDTGFSERLDISRDSTCMRKRIADQMLSYGQEANSGHDSIDGQVDPQDLETGSRTHAYRRPADRNMDYMINQQEKLTDLWDFSLDPVISNGFQVSNNNSGKESHAMPDESFVVLHRTGSSDEVTDGGRTAMDMDYQLPLARQKTENDPVGTTGYEPNYLNLMPNRVVEGGQSGYDPAMDYEMQAQAKETAKNSNREQVTPGTKEGPRKSVKDQKLKAERRNTAGMRREKPSKLSPSEDARARAEKLRAFKADLQKLKKEKEEEQLERLEALKMQRQKRIAARSGATLPLSPLPSQQSRKQLPKLSPGSQKGSKFSDVEPGSSSPLQRSTLKNVSKLLSDSAKVSKSGRATSGSQTNGNRLTRSASSLSMRKEENNSLTPDSKAATDRIRRLSEPKSGVHHVAIGMMRSAEAMSRRKVAEKPEMKKVSVTAKSDKSKFLALPEQKLRASKGSVSIQKKTTNKEMTLSSRDTTLSNTFNTNLSRGMSHLPEDDDDSTVVEKTVVILEYEKPATTVSHAAEDQTSVHNMQTDAGNDPGGRQEEAMAVPPPASPIVVKEVDSKPCAPDVKVQSCAYKNEGEEASPNLHDVHTTGKPYQAPHARVSSLEDPCMAESQYGKTPVTSLDTSSARVQTDKVLVSDSLRQDFVEMSEAAPGKSLGKESSKGFKRLLKFGKKSSAASESNIELDNTCLDGSVASDAGNGSSSEAFTLKNLLTQEESSSAGTASKKSSRSFSLFSPFKSKAADKKSTA